MADIVPTITAEDSHHYREQMERVAGFASRIHIDFADGQFAPTKLVDIQHAWWGEDKIVDFHLMYKRPELYIEEALELQPQLLIIHAEADNAQTVLKILPEKGVKRGVALLPDTPVEAIGEWLTQVDHVLVFGGRLGYQGSEADLSLLDKVRKLKEIGGHIEIGWDGGVNLDNVAKIMEAGVDVINVGGFIQHAQDPPDAYAKLLKIVGR